VSLRIGDYEALKDASVDPYEAVRDAYLRLRLKKMND
jgi:phospholipid-binding lipoprotein MlaA